MRRFLITTALSACILANTGFAQDATYDASTVLARVNGAEITLGHVILMRERLPNEYKSMPAPALKTALIDQLVSQTLLSELQSASPESDPLTLKLSLELERRAALAGLKVGELSEAPVSDDAIAARYDEIKADFKPRKEYHAAHILVDDENRAKELLAEIEAGADFGEVAKENSSDGAAANGGDLGWFGEGQMVPEFENAVKEMEGGAVSGPIQTQFGWHLVKLFETRDVELPPLDQLKPRIEAELREKNVRAAIETLRNDADIEIVETDIPAEAITNLDLLEN